MTGGSDAARATTLRSNRSDAATLTRGGGTANSRGVANFVKRFLIQSIPEPLRSLIAGQGQRRSYMLTSGWARSFREKAPVTKEGEPLPWYTYPAIRFLEGRVRKPMRVFEFGAGNSTRWWAERVAEVVSREHDRSWIDRIRRNLDRPNVRLEWQPVDSDAYVAAPEGEYQIVVVDGRRRVECARNSVQALSGDGVLIWDNSNRERYQEGFDFLAASGFRRLDFWGVVPGGVKEISTTIFYGEHNCLGI